MSKKLFLILLFLILLFLIPSFSFSQQVSNVYDIKTTSLTTPAFNIANRNISYHSMSWSFQQLGSVTPVVSACTLTTEVSSNNVNWVTQNSQSCLTAGSLLAQNFVTNWIRFKATTFTLSAGNALLTINYTGFISDPTNTTSIVGINGLEFARQNPATDKRFRLINDTSGQLAVQMYTSSGTWVTEFTVPGTFGHLTSQALGTPDGDGDNTLVLNSLATQFSGLVFLHGGVQRGDLGHQDYETTSVDRQWPGAADMAAFNGTGDISLFGTELSTGESWSKAGNFHSTNTGFFPTDVTPPNGGSVILHGTDSGGINYRVTEKAGNLIIQPEHNIATDNFNRANGALGANWTMLNGATAADLGIVSNELKYISTNEATAQYTGTAIPNDEAVEAIFKVQTPSASTGKTAGVLARVTDVNNYYRLAIEANTNGTSTVDLLKRVAGVNTIIATQTGVGGVTWSRSATRYYKLRLEVKGSLLEAYLDGEKLFRIKDTDLTTGGAGFDFFQTNTSTTAYAQYFAVYDLTYTGGFTVTSTGGITAGAGRTQISKGANVASANNLTLGIDGNIFNITAGTQINLIDSTSWQAGSDIYLEFASTPTVKYNQAASGAFAPIILNGSVDFVATANSVLHLIYDGTNWVEAGRSKP